ncbi:MAG TPA: signal peptidase I [Thermoanaerobaculia bacterium]|jgi:signal peptidase I|nr:signal peptidase I [Thermoanaerobaculia bacterium]
MQAEKSLLREYLEALLIAVIFATFARTWIVQAFKIPSGSMEQNLLIGDHILVNKFIYGPTVSPLEEKLLPIRKVRRGDVVVFKYPEDPTRDFIKRCMGLPGDTLKMIGRDLYINDQLVNDSPFTYYADPESDSGGLVFPPRSPRASFGPKTVPPDSYFCMGDNRDNSNDSRYWGPVPESYLKGRAFMVYWSFASDEEYLQPAGYGNRMRQIGQVALNFFTQTRWDRTFRIVR